MEELLGIAILAYRSSRYWDAIELLIQIGKRTPTNWLARLYLGISYQRCSHLTHAIEVFKSIADECPDLHLAQQATNALELIEQAKVRASKSEPPVLTKQVRTKPESWRTA
ncbi:MAG TPA: hypothetical protein V6D22_13250 [Candidatus Obscuribacterales bacterium]